jgi:hypothetical protein
MHYLVPFEAFLEIELLLTRYQQSAQQVDIRVTDILIRDAGRLRLRACCRLAAAKSRVSCRANKPGHALLLFMPLKTVRGSNTKTFRAWRPANFDICFISQASSTDDGAEYDCFRGSAAAARPMCVSGEQTSCAGFAWLNRHAG